MSLPTLPDLEPSLYRWHPSPSRPGAVQRLANGTEAWVGIKSENARGQYDFYVATTLRIAPAGSAKDMSLSGLRENIALALAQIPHAEMFCEAVWPEDGGATPWIVYQQPKRKGEGLDRARRLLEMRTGGMTAFELREQLVEEQRKRAVQTPAPSVRMWLVADVEDVEVPLREGMRVELLTRFNHVFWDGISARMMVGEMLTRLGRTKEEGRVAVPVADETGLFDSTADVRTSYLSEPLLEACKIDVEALKGDGEFKNARDEFITALISSGTSWGLPVADGTGTPSTEWYHFTKTQSQAIIRAVKRRIGPEYTISHLGHAATVLALLKARPLPADDMSTKLVTPLPLNGRRYLRDDLAKGNYLLDEHANVQYGACQAGAVVEFPRLSQWMVDPNDSRAVDSAITDLTTHVKKGYDYWLSKPFQLAICVAKDNFLSAVLSSAPSSSSGSSIPIFVADGVIDRYLHGAVTDSLGNQLILIDDCKFLLDLYNDGLLIRMESWMGSTSLSFCFNDGTFKPEDAAKFLEDVAGFMLAFAE